MPVGRPAYQLIIQSKGIDGIKKRIKRIYSFISV